MKRKAKTLYYVLLGIFVSVGALYAAVTLKENLGQNNSSQDVDLMAPLAISASGLNIRSAYNNTLPTDAVNSPPWGHEATVAIGQNNNLSLSFASLGVGVNNTLTDPDGNNGGSFASGYVNTVSRDYGCAIGQSNHVHPNNTGVIQSGIALGVGIQVPPPPAPQNSASLGSVIVGTYNDTAAYTTAGEAVMFGVGRGDGGVGNQRNAMTVYKSGKIVIDVPQGDISMGGYGN